MLAATALLSVFRGLLVHDRFLLGFRGYLRIRAAGDSDRAQSAEGVCAERKNFAPRTAAGLLGVVFHGVVLILRLLVFGRFPVLNRQITAQ